MSDDLRNLNNELTRLLSQMPRPPGKEDWVYKDLPGMMTLEYWEMFLNLMGPENYQIIAQTTLHKEGVKWYRGQFWVSPQGVQNLIEYAKAQRQ